MSVGFLQHRAPFSTCPKCGQVEVTLQRFPPVVSHSPKRTGWGWGLKSTESQADSTVITWWHFHCFIHLLPWLALAAGTADMVVAVPLCDQALLLPGRSRIAVPFRIYLCLWTSGRHLHCIIHGAYVKQFHLGKAIQTCRYVLLILIVYKCFHHLFITVFSDNFSIYCKPLRGFVALKWNPFSV